MAEFKFTCVIKDLYHDDLFSACITIKKKSKLRATWHERHDGASDSPKDRVELSDILITPVSGQVGKVHHHFVLYNLEGDGVYMLRDQNGNEVDRRPCSIWDLGPAFANKVMGILKDIA